MAAAPEFSISLQNRGALARPEHLVSLAERADALGYDALWVTDHVVLPMTGSPRIPARWPRRSIASRAR